MTAYRPILHTRRDPVPDSDPHGAANPVAAVCLHAGVTALLLALALQTGLPLLAAAGLAWIGGAVATVALLLAADAAGRQGALAVTTRAEHRTATAPDL